MALVVTGEVHRRLGSQGKLRHAANLTLAFPMQCLRSSSQMKGTALTMSVWP
jgi:hypothetical protein